MSKKIDTLIEDIYKTIDEGLDKRKVNTDFLDTFKKNMMASIDKFLFEKREDLDYVKVISNRKT